MFKRHKKLMIFCGIAIVSCAAFLAYYFPVQRSFCEKKYYQYIAEQGIQSEDIESIRYYKDYTQDGYYIDVRYKSDPEYVYEYQYFLVTKTKNDGIKYNVMKCCVYDNQNCSVASGMKYPPLT